MGGAGSLTVSPLSADIIVEKDVRIDLKDGAFLMANIFRPSTHGKTPVLMHCVPYSKDDVCSSWTALGVLPVPLSSPLPYKMMRYALGGDIGNVHFSEATPWEAMDPATWVPRGYACIMIDSRGFNKAGGAGIQGSFGTQQEADDYREAIEWAARQPWSTGKVGLLGVSYLAISQWNCAARAPTPALAAICPWEGLHDFYQMCFPGAGWNQFGKLWMGKAAAAAPGGMCEDMKAEWEDAVENNCERTDFWKTKRIPVEKISGPAILACATWSDQGVHTQIRGATLDAWELAASPKKYLYTHGGKKWEEFYACVDVQHQFFECFLKGNGNFDSPFGRVRLEVRETHEVRHQRWEKDWPIARTVFRQLFLGPDEHLETQQVQSPEETEVVVRAGRDTASFTHFFSEDTEVTGHAEICLYVELDNTDDADIVVQVHKLDSHGDHVYFDGVMGDTKEGVMKGTLRVSHRTTLNVAKSKPGRPFYDRDSSHPLEEGEVALLRIPMTPSSTLFRAGEGLEVSIGAGINFSRHLPVTQGGLLTQGSVSIKFHAQHPSSILLPIVPDGPALLARSPISNKHTWHQ